MHSNNEEIIFFLKNIKKKGKLEITNTNNSIKVAVPALRVARRKNFLLIEGGLFYAGIGFKKAIIRIGALTFKDYEIRTVEKYGRIINLKFSYFLKNKNNLSSLHNPTLGKFDAFVDSDGKEIEKFSINNFCGLFNIINIFHKFKQPLSLINLEKLRNYGFNNAINVLNIFFKSGFEISSLDFEKLSQFNFSEYSKINSIEIFIELVNTLEMKYSDESRYKRGEGWVTTSYSLGSHLPKDNYFKELVLLYFNSSNTLGYNQRPFVHKGYFSITYHTEEYEFSVPKEFHESAKERLIKFLLVEGFQLFSKDKYMCSLISLQKEDNLNESKK